MFLKVISKSLKLSVFRSVPLATFNPFNYGVIWLLIKTEDQALLLFCFYYLIFHHLILFVFDSATYWCICRINTIAHVLICCLNYILTRTWRLLLHRIYCRKETGERSSIFCVSIALMFCQIRFWPGVFTCSSCSSKKSFLHVSKAASQLLWYSAFFFYF